VPCFTLDGTNKKRGIFGSGKPQTAATPGGIARTCTTARAKKTLFYVPYRVKHGTRRLPNLQIVGCKSAAAVHFLPSFCPWPGYGAAKAAKLSSLGPIGVKASFFAIDAPRPTASYVPGWRQGA
jgi:hypothetical protein